MKMKLLFVSYIALALSVFSQNATLPQLNKNNIKQVIAAMTLEEKAKLVNGTGFNVNGMTPMDHKPANAREDKVLGSAGNSYAIPRLGIPSLVFADGPAGLRIQPIRYGDKSKTFYATAFPIGSMLASSWDTTLVRKVGAAYGHEGLEYGIDVILAPGMNIHRNPLCGRNFEYYSEDPLVTGSIGTAFIKGIQSVGVGTSMKHFAVNNEESNRALVNEIVSERALREIYLRGFEIAAKESKPWTIMSSYNKVNGTYTSQSHDLLTTILRKDWNYRGMVMSDWLAGDDDIAQMKAGNNLIMPGGGKGARAIVAAVKNGTLDEKVLDENVECILNMVVKSPVFHNYKYSDKPDLKKDAEISKMAAEESAVLLKNNDNALPINKKQKIALFGNTSYDMIIGGTGSGDVNEAYIISLNQGLRNSGCIINQKLEGGYTDYIKYERLRNPKTVDLLTIPKLIDEMPLSPELLTQQASEADVAVFTIGRISGEGTDRKVENDFNLSNNELQRIKVISDAFHAKGKKIVVFLNVGGVVEVASWRNMVDAIILGWLPGQEGGNAIADVLTGKANPSGKLAATFPVKYEDVSSSKSFPGKNLAQGTTKITHIIGGVQAETYYNEGVYVGYRYFNTFNVKPAYEFGYGLSYTNFTYDKLTLTSTQFTNKITATLAIKNVGKVAGKEVVELYLSAPAKNIDKPTEELKAFAKTRLLQPGESQILSFTLYAKDLSSYITQKNQWVAEAGEYTVKIGASSLNIRQSKSFRLANDVVVEKTSKSLVPLVNINELKN